MSISGRTRGKICSGFKATLSIGTIKWTGNISYVNNQLLMAHNSDGAAVYITASAFANILGTDCSYNFIENYAIGSIPAHNYPTVVLWTNN